MKLTVTESALDDVFGDVARLHLDHRPNANAGKIISLKVGSKRVYAVARGLRSGTNKKNIALESALRERLDVEPSQEYDFTVEATGFWGSVCWAWNSTDAMPRVAVRLSVISLGLGLIGFFLGVASICR